MRLDKYITEIEELGVGVNTTETKELTVKFSDVAFASTTSPITRNRTKVGVFLVVAFHTLFTVFTHTCTL